MNNREAYTSLKRYLPDLELKSTYHGVNEDPSYTFSNLTQYRIAIKKLLNSGVFVISHKTLEQVKPILENTEKIMPMAFSPGYSVEGGANTIYEIANGLYEYLSNQLKDENEETVDVKLVKIDDLEEMEKIANLLKKSFSIPVTEVGGKITVSSLENGSVWIILGVIGVGGAALKMCANLVWAAAVIHRKYEEVKQNQDHLKSIKLSNDVIEQVNQQQIGYIEESKQTEALAIAQEYSISGDPEAIQRLKLAIESIGNLIDKGVQFYPSVKASEEIKKLFPDFNLLNLIESKTKLIDSGEGEN